MTSHRNVLLSHLPDKVQFCAEHTINQEKENGSRVIPAVLSVRAFWIFASQFEAIKRGWLFTSYVLGAEFDQTIRNIPRSPFSLLGLPKPPTVGAVRREGGMDGQTDEKMLWVTWEGSHSNRDQWE